MARGFAARKPDFHRKNGLRRLGPISNRNESSSEREVKPSPSGPYNQELGDSLHRDLSAAQDASKALSLPRPAAVATAGSEPEFLRSKTMADRGHRRRRRPHQAAPVGDAHQDEPKLAVRDPRNVPEAEYARSVLQPNTNQDPSIMTWMDEDRNNKKDLKRSGRVSKKELNSFEVPTNLAGQRRELQSIYKGICTNVNTNTMLRRRYLKLALKIKDEELSRSKDALQLLEWIEESMEEISRLQAQVRDLHGPPYDLPKVLSCELKLKEKKKKKKKGHSK